MDRTTPHDWLRTIRTALPDRRLSPRQGILLVTIAIGSVVAIDPAAAQEGCSSALDAVFNTIGGMTFGYGRPLIVILLFVGLIAMVTSPIHPAQAIVGGVVVASIIVGMVLLIAVTAFTSASFDAMGAPEACVSIIDDEALLFALVSTARRSPIAALRAMSGTETTTSSGD